MSPADRKLAWWVAGSCLVAIAGIVLISVALNPAHWQVMAKFWTSSRPIDFFGKVVDQNGTPIPGAVVSVAIESFDTRSINEREGNHFKQRVLERRTDAAGAFSVKGESGTQLQIRKVSADGYVALPEADWTYEPYFKQLFFNYWPSQGNYLYIPDPAKPALLPLRREGEPRRIGPSKGGVEKLR